MASQARLVHFDVLKGIAILLVVLGHIFVYAGGPMYDRSILLSLLNSIHMPLFMMLSGYFLARPLDLSRDMVYRFWRSKVIRLLIPLLFAPVLFDWMRYGIGVCPNRAIFQEYWFTSVLFAFTVLVYLLRFVAYRLNLHSWGLGIGVIIWTIVVVYVADIILDLSIPIFIQLFLDKVAWLFPYIMLGYCLGAFNGVLRWVQREDVGALAFGGYVALLWSEYAMLEALTPPTRLLTFTGLIACYSLAYNGIYRRLGGELSWLSCSLAYLGRESLPIYLTHYFFVPALPWMKDFLESITYRQQVFAWEFALGALGVVMTLVPTLLMIRIIKCNKYLTLLFYGEMIK